MIAPEQVAIDAALDFFRRRLPAQVTSINATRFAVLKAALVGPYTVPVGAVLRLSDVSPQATPTSVVLPPGSRTAADLATEINTGPVAGILASADSDGRLVLTATAAPAAGTPSVVVVSRDVVAGVATGSNAVFGWSEGGEHVAVPAIVAPSWRGVVDGRAITAPDMGGGFWLLMGNRSCVPDGPGIRKNQYVVTIQCELWRPFGASAVQHRTREAITSCVRAVREVVRSDTQGGPYLGTTGEVQMARVDRVTISANTVKDDAAPGLLWDSATFTLTCRVFQRPD